MDRLRDIRWKEGYEAGYSDGRRDAVVHAHWEWLEEDKYRCTHCYGQTRVDEVMGQPIYTICPFCGAVMDEEVEQ